MKRAISILFVVSCFAGATSSQSANTAVPIPVLVELFTSEGCSSCPPADAWLQRLDSAQPIPGAQLIVLSEHVDYWDHDGWKDPYSSSSNTERQTEYVRALGLEGPATPEVIVDGAVNLHLADTQQVKATLQQAANASVVPVRIASFAVEAGSASAVRARIEVDGSSAPHGADIYEAVALNHAESQVLHGENSGKHLEHTAVLQSLTKIGKVERGKNFSRELEVKLKPGTDAKDIRLIVFAQQPGPGKVLGAAMQQGIH
jgi:hypothetical protein